MYICLAQTSKTLIGREKTTKTRVVVLDKQLQREISCYGCF